MGISVLTKSAMTRVAPARYARPTFVAMRAEVLLQA
jgi:hypothetical protein